MYPILVGNDKGGVGKDITAEGLLLAAQRRQLRVKLIELESSPRLSLVYPDDAITIAINAPSPGALYGNPDVIYEPIDRAAPFGCPNHCLSHPWAPT
jgi:hypothetical protein